MLRVPWSSTRVRSNGSGPSNADIVGKALTAGGERINLSDRGEADRARKQRQDWWDDALVYFDTVPEVKALCRYRAAMISKCRLLPAWVPGPGKMPVALDALDDKGRPLAPVPEAVANVAFDTLARLDQSPSGIPGILYALTVNLDTAGECHLVGFGPRPEFVQAGEVVEGTDEKWQIKSVAETKTQDGKWVIKNAPKAVRGGILTEDDFITRLWQNHPHDSEKADSPLHGVLDICEEILSLQRAARAAVLCRLNAGVLGVSSDFSFGGPDPTMGEEGGLTGVDKFKYDLQTAMITPIQNEGSAGAVVPIVVTGPTEAIEKGFKHFTFDRPLDSVLDERLELRVKRLGRGLDAPVERALGYTETTFTNSTAITIDDFRIYLEPTIMGQCAMLTSGFFRPLLEAAGVSRDLLRNLVVWYDPSELVAEPDRRPTANEAHAKLAISDATYRRETGFSEEDAPSEEELLRRLGLTRGTVDGPLTEVLLRLIDAALPAPERPVAAIPASARTLVAAARPDIGRRLMEIDRALRSRLESLADYHVKRALEKAGARVRSKTASGSKLVAKSTNDVPNYLVPSTVGPSFVAAAGLTEDELLEGSFDGLHDEYDQRVRRAQRASLDVLARSGVLDEDERAELEAQQDEDRQSSWAWFLASLLGLARTRLFDPTPAATPGEFDGLATVPPGVVREAVARAGGARGLESRGGALTTAGGTQPAGGIGTGQLVQDTFARHGWQITGWEWVYGDPSTRQTNFEPHLALDGQVIRDWNSDDLSVGEDTWLATTGYRPGDHRGCSCSFIPVYAETGNVAA